MIIAAEDLFDSTKIFITCCSRLQKIKKYGKIQRRILTTCLNSYFHVHDVMIHHRDEYNAECEKDTHHLWCSYSFWRFVLYGHFK